MNVLDLFSGDQDQRQDSASCPARHGRSGKVPRPSPASYWSCCARLHCADVRACAQRQGLALRRRTDTRGERRGVWQRTFSGFRQGQASLWISRNTHSAWLDFFRRTSTDSVARFSASTRKSSAIDWHQSLFFPPQKPVRTVCNAAETCARVFVAATEPSASNRPNTIWRSPDQHQKLFRSVRNVGVSSCLK